MKSIVQITLFSEMLMIVSLGRLCGQGQACITFHSDYSGLEWDAAERARSTTAACSLRTLIADAGVSGFMSHSCQLSLNDTSLDAYDIRDIGDYVSLSIPEQGIQGIYTVTDIRKINLPRSHLMKIPAMILFFLPSPLSLLTLPMMSGSLHLTMEKM
jgi:hypothetical protein